MNTIPPILANPTPSATEHPEAGSGSSEPAAHVLAAPFPEPAPAVNDVADGEAGDTVAPGDAGTVGRLSREAFRKSFFGTFKGGARFSGLQSLAIPDELQEEGEAAADALYDTACEVSWLNWMVQPGNIWVQRAIVFGMFGFAIGQGVGVEIAARKKNKAENSATKKQEETTPFASNDTSDAWHKDMAPLGLVSGEKEATSND